MFIYRLFRHEEWEQSNRYIYIFFYFVARFGYTRLPQSEECGGIKRISAGCLERVLRGRWAYQSLWHPRHLVVVTILWPGPHVCDQWSLCRQQKWWMPATNTLTLNILMRKCSSWRHTAAPAPGRSGNRDIRHETWNISLSSHIRIKALPLLLTGSRIPYFIIPVVSLRSICITLIWRHGGRPIKSRIDPCIEEMNLIWSSHESHRPKIDINIS